MTNNQQIKKNLYLSFDVETDGPSPLVNNLISIGIIGLTEEKEILFEFEANIEPLEDHTSDELCMNTFWLKPEQENAWKYANTNKQNYVSVFENLGLQLKNLDVVFKLIFVAQPACFDWMFFKCYYELAKTKSLNKDNFYDIGYQCRCISTLFDYYKKLNNMASLQANKLFKELGEFDETTNHHALYDAKVQGKFYIELLKKMNN